MRFLWTDKSLRKYNKELEHANQYLGQREIERAEDWVRRESKIIDEINALKYNYEKEYNHIKSLYEIELSKNQKNQKLTSQYL